MLLMTVFEILNATTYLALALQFSVDSQYVYMPAIVSLLTENDEACHTELPISKQWGEDDSTPETTRRPSKAEMAS